jgi:hypothetical protein
MRKSFIPLIFFVAIQTFTFCQGFKLKSARHGLDLIYKRNVSKEEIIENVRFLDGRDESIDIIRFDNVATTIGGDGPLIISSKEPIQVDSLGLIPLKLHADSLVSLMYLIEASDTKIYTRTRSEYLFRVTYRSNGNIQQYYIAEAASSTNYFKKIESWLLNVNNNDALEKFYRFLGPSRLLNYSSKGVQWKY